MRTIVQWKRLIQMLQRAFVVINSSRQRFYGKPPLTSAPGQGRANRLCCLSRHKAELLCFLVLRIVYYAPEQVVGPRLE